MSFWQLVLIILTVILLSVGQILFKVAAEAINISRSGFIGGFLSPKLIAALVVYAFATFAWILVLRVTPLRVAYPFVALAFFIVPVLAHFFLDERLGWNTIAGSCLIAFGVWVSILK